MTKEEAIRATEYTENELIEIALAFAAEKMLECRDQGDNTLDEWFHYENLRNAFKAMRDERRAKEVA